MIKKNAGKNMRRDDEKIRDGRERRRAYGKVLGFQMTNGRKEGKKRMGEPNRCVAFLMMKKKGEDKGKLTGRSWVSRTIKK